MNAQVIVTLRKLLGLSQEKLAEKVGYSRSMIARIEIERIPVSRQFERKLTNTFGAETIYKARVAVQLFNE